MTPRIVVGISGASGMPYAVRQVELLASGGAAIDVVTTDHALPILRDEAGLELEPDGRPRLESLWPDEAARRGVTWHAPGCMSAAIASGSMPTGGMVVCPASMHTVGALAAGLADNLLLRAAQVTLKESRRLIVVPRETPMSAVMLEAMARLARSGAVVLPACPAFYHHPAEVRDLVDFVVARILDLLGVPHNLGMRWDGGGTAGC